METDMCLVATGEGEQEVMIVSRTRRTSRCIFSKFSDVGCLTCVFKNSMPRIQCHMAKHTENSRGSGSSSERSTSQEAFLGNLKQRQILASGRM